MARILQSVFSFIVLISLVRYGSITTAIVTPSPATTSPGGNPTLVTPSPTSPGSNPTSTPALATTTATPAAATTVTPTGNATSVAPATSGNVGDITVTEVQKSSATVSTTVIAPTSSGNVASSSVPTASTKRFKARVTVNATYESDYNNISSQKSQDFINTFTANVRSYLNGRLTGNISIKVNILTKGSVVVDFDIIAPQSSNATESSIKQALEEGNKISLGYNLIGNITVTEVQKSSATVSPTVTVLPSPRKSTPVTKATPAPPTSSTKGTEFWDKAIDMATPMGTFIIVVVAVALIIILLIALICVCCKYRNLKKKTHFPDHMAINDSEWIRSSDDLLMWERNLRASEVKTTNGVSNRPINDKRTA